MMEAGTTRRVALVGAGYIADWHAKSIASVAGVELVAVCDPFVSRAQAIADRYGIAKVYGSLDAMLAAEKLDAVHILIPPDRHFEAARMAIEAGVSVLLEKPMCDNAADCDKLARLAAERGVRLGVGHNFLFSEPYERLRRDVKAGVLGPIDQVTITWNRFLPQSMFGPFDIWMLRDARNIMIEIGSHSVAHMLDLVGEPDVLEARAGNAIVLPTGKRFYRRWQVSAGKGRTAVELRFSFVPGFGEYNLHVRGALASATADLERNTYTLEQYRASDPDFENFAMLKSKARSLKEQGRRTLQKYILSKLKIEKRGTSYGESISRGMDAFYGGGADIDTRIEAETGARVIAICERIGALANLPAEVVAPLSIRSSHSVEVSHPCDNNNSQGWGTGHPHLAAGSEVATAPMKTAGEPTVLVLGGTGFIGRELTRQLVDKGLGVRLLVRSAASVPESIRSQVDCVRGDVMNRQGLLDAMKGVECVVHLARSNVKTWADYQKYEIEATRQVAECALEAGVKRFVYTGTIDSYYGGSGAGTISEATPLDSNIAHRNLYARAKAESEAILIRMQLERRLPLVIVRPGIVIGRGGSPFHWGVGMWWHDAVCQIWGEGRHKLPLVLVEDVASGLIAAMERPGIEGRTFNLVADPCLSAHEYLDELDRAGGMKIQRFATPILRFYLMDMMKWAVKVAVRHPERRMPSYRDWESRTAQARFDCGAAKRELGWKPVSERGAMVERGIAEPLREFLT